MGEVKHTPGQRLFDACALAFNFRRTWANGNAVQHAEYERAAKDFLASDPMTAAAPEMFRALKAILADCHDQTTPSIREMCRAALAKAQP